MKVILKEDKRNKKTLCFLGGTCNDSQWREKLIPKLEIEYFDPVVEDWTEADYENELSKRKIADFLLYVITPKQEGFYSIAELIDDSHRKKGKTIFCYLKKDGEKEFTKAQLKSLEAIGKMIEINGAKWAKNLEEVADIVNKG